MSTRTRAGLTRFPRLGPGARIALVAPASPCDRPAFDAGVLELARLGFDPIYDERVFARRGFVAGDALTRAGAFLDAWRRPDVDALLAVRGGYGSAEILPFLDRTTLVARPKAFIGYSDVTAVQTWLGRVGLASVHGAMIDGRLSAGSAAYDVNSFLAALGDVPMDEVRADDLEALRPGAGEGPLVGGTLTQLLASFGTPFEFQPPERHVLFLDEVGERPYRLQRMLTQWQQAGRFSTVTAVVFGQLPRCDEPGGAVTARAVVADFFSESPFPVLFGLPVGHAVSPLISVPLGVHVRVETHPHPRIVFDEAAGLGA